MCGPVAGQSLSKSAQRFFNKKSRWSVCGELWRTLERGRTKKKEREEDVRWVGLQPASRGTSFLARAAHRLHNGHRSATTLFRSSKVIFYDPKQARRWNNSSRNFQRNFWRETLESRSSRFSVWIFVPLLSLRSPIALRSEATKAGEIYECYSLFLFN